MARELPDAGASTTLITDSAVFGTMARVHKVCVCVLACLTACFTLLSCKSITLQLLVSTAI